LKHIKVQRISIQIYEASQYIFPLLADTKLKSGYKFRSNTILLFHGLQKYLNKRCLLYFRTLQYVASTSVVPTSEIRTDASLPQLHDVPT